MSIKDRLFQRPDEKTALRVESNTAVELMRELVERGNEHAKYLLNMCDQGMLPIVYIPRLSGRWGASKAISAIGHMAEFNGQSGVAYVLIVRGDRVNGRKIARGKKGVLDEMEEGLEDVHRVIKKEYLQGRSAIVYPYHLALNMLAADGIIPRMNYEIEGGQI